MRTFMIISMLFSLTVGCDKKQEPAKTDPAAKIDPKADPKAGDLLNPPAGGAAQGGMAPIDKATPEELEKGKDVNPSAVATGNPSEDELVSLMEKMAVVVEKHPKDCVKLGTELKAFVESNTATLEKFKTWEKRLSDEEKKAFAMRAATRLMPLMAKMAPMMTCAMDPNFAKMMEGLPMGK
jgi:hypothetical protein